MSTGTIHVVLSFAAQGANATTQVMWAEEPAADEPGSSDTDMVLRQEGQEGGVLTIGARGFGFANGGRRAMGHAVLRNDALVATAVFHARLFEDDCRVKGTVTPTA